METEKLKMKYKRHEVYILYFYFEVFTISFNVKIAY
jgi:hypothetical protein